MDFIGPYSVENITLTKALKDALLQINIQLNLCRGQAYDGAANMLGKLKGVATQILKENQSAVTIN